MSTIHDTRAVPVRPPLHAEICSAQRSSGGARGPGGWAVLGLLAVVVAAAYWPSLGAPLIFDDIDAIRENPHVRQLWPLTQAMGAPRDTSVSGRPVVSLTLAINYALSGLDVWSYHLFNLVSHVCNAWLVFAVLRGVLRGPTMAVALSEASGRLGLAGALIWAAHPLGSDAVVSIVNRTELLGVMFYLLTLWASLRAWGSSRPGRWCVVATVASALGMASKEMAVTAPVMVVLMDVVLRGEAVRLIAARRWKLWAALASTWVMLGALMAQSPRSGSVGFEGDMPWWQYAVTQLWAMGKYVQLSVVPVGLNADYGYEAVTDLSRVLPGGVVVAALAGVAAWSVVRRKAAGFVAVWVLVILAPTSSVVPIVTQVAAERRMYLPLAAVVAAAVVGGYWLMRRTRGPGGKRATALAAALGVVVMTLAGLTMARAMMWREPARLWADSIEKQPRNARAYISQSGLLHDEGRSTEAVMYLHRALVVEPGCFDALYRLGLIHAGEGEDKLAMGYLSRAVRLKPDHDKALNTMGTVYLRRGQLGEASACFEKAMALREGMAEYLNNMGLALHRMGELESAHVYYRRAIAAGGNTAAAQNNLGTLLLQMSRLSEAAQAFGEAIAIGPVTAEYLYNMGLVLKRMGQVEEGMARFRLAMAREPGFVPAYVSLGVTLLRDGVDAEALGLLEEAVAMAPGSPSVHGSYAMALALAGRFDAAAAQAEQALSVNPADNRSHAAMWLVQRSRGEDSEASLTAALKQGVADTEMLLQVGGVLASLGRAEDAAACQRQAAEAAARGSGGPAVMPMSTR